MSNSDEDEEYDDYSVYWTDNITNGVGIAWLVTAMFWALAVFLAWQNAQESAMVGFVLIWVVILIVAPIAMIVGPTAAVIAIIGACVTLLVLFFRAGFRERSSTMIGTAGCAAISFAGILTISILSIKALAEAWPH